MAERIAFENGQISNFEGLATLILTLDQVIVHTYEESKEGRKRGMEKES